MNKYLIGLLATVGVAVSQGAAVAQSAPPPGRALPPEVQRQVDLSYLLANGDLNPDYLPTLLGELTNPGEPTPLAALFASKEVVAAKAFDNLYYVGGEGVGTWTLDTPEGIILFDAMNNAHDAENIVIPGMRDLGLDPARIKYLVVMHAHGDHYGGAKYIQDTFGAKVLLSAEDWQVLAETPAVRNGRPVPTPPRREPGSDVVDGQVLSLGGVDVTLYVTPGHTPGTLSAIFSATDGGRPHVISFWGGNGMPTTAEPTPISGGLHAYREQLVRFTRLAIDAGVDAVISNHPVVDNTVAKARLDRQAHPANPWVIGADAYLRWAGSNIAAMDAGLAGVEAGVFPVPHAEH